jgi:hypothetical protein
MIKYVGSQKKRTISINSSSFLTFASTSTLDQGVYKVFESSSPEDYASVFWNGDTFNLITFPDSKFIRQNLSTSNKICFYIDNTNLIIKNNYNTSKTIITWLEN